ncbi:hypothetical protein ACAH01_14655 [Halomicrobium sp. HM KBTZ05]|uniref:Uncharacterized protein n=1 Tax=Halomicrobium mukohataei TaxID=57705 RepID=A0A847UDS9_9EURY|nr:hypothetical protein [Halomicrobium mukohataei]NLV09554.1 hypothetical protein [Halomicrobium mukohataei]
MASTTADRQSEGTLATESLTTLHWAGIGLAAITGAIHLWLGVSFLSSPMGLTFLFAGVVYVGAIIGVLLDVRRRLLYLLGIPFTAGQIPIWLAVNWPDLGAIGIGDKVVQVALIAVLAVLYRRSG